MKKAFTLVEMLIVVVVLVTLMSMVFRLGSVGGSSAQRNRTISRLQRVENCLSGYYAAFGTYPPVALHGSRNIYAKVNSHGIQSDTEVNNNLVWEQVDAACRSQPVDACFPFPDKYSSYVSTVSRALQEKANKAAQGDERYKKYDKETLRQGFDDASGKNIGRFNPYSGESDWKNLQLFKFGLLSYLLPRYLVMINGDEAFLEFDQWTDNNTLPRDPLNDDELTWNQVREYQQSENAENRARVSNIPSQAVTARWMPNLEGIVASQHTWELYGISVSSTDDSEKNLSSDNPNIDIYEPGDFSKDSHSQQYVLDSVTVLDGWSNSFYYYSPAPYQSYVLWSAGPNGRTFPPWVPLNSQTLSPTDRETVGSWIKDDIIQLSN